MQVARPATPHPIEPASPQPPPPWTHSGWGKQLACVKDSEVNPSFLGHVLISGSIIGLAILAYVVPLALVFDKAKEWEVCSRIPQQKPEKPEKPGIKLPNKGDDSSLNLEQVKQNITNLGTADLKNVPLRSQKDRLITQVQQLNQAQQTACTIGIYFFANRTATSTVATATGIAALASLAFVSKKGWEQSNNAIINLGVTSGLILFSTLTFSQLYGQGSNFENQRTKQNLSIDLLNRVASASANGSAQVTIPDAKTNPKEVDINLNTSAGLQQFIRALDRELQTLHKLDFGLDDSFAKTAFGQISPRMTPTQKPTLATPTSTNP